MITISDGSTTIDLPSDLIWSDEFDTTQVAQSLQRTLSGALVRFESQKHEGRKITLNSDIDSGWTDRATVKLLRAMFEIADQALELSFHGETYDVIVDRSSGSGLRAVPVIDCSDASDDSKYSVSIDLLTYDV